METSKLKAEQAPAEAERRSQFVRSNEASTTARTANSWQEEAARLLLRSGFRPGDTIGQVEHIISPRSDFGQTRPSPAGAMRLLFGASAIGAMPESRTDIRNVKDLRVRAEQTSRTFA